MLLPFPTPFNEGGEVDAQALRRNVERWGASGVSGYVALGSTGERVHLDEREICRVIETARATAPGHLAFVVGVGQQSVRGSVGEARRAAELGADALLVITPHFYRGEMTQQLLADFFTAVADASTVPLLLYNIPQNAGVTTAPETVARLAEHANIIGIKDSSGDMVSLTETLRLVPEDFAVLTGHASVFYPALAAGARGGILAAACVVPELAVAIHRAFEAGEHARAAELQRRFVPVARAVTTRFGIGGLKHAMELRGYAGGTVRAPLRMPDEAARREIAELLEEALRALGAEGRAAGTGDAAEEETGSAAAGVMQ